ncbi:MAG TPA: isoprenylcysteine carboxylmethyltransferase family protein [Mycobacterium sp.]|nr:isoprenylcysteine carboxylmethyltransferase family protein [Mycobacterium sp.]
MRSRSAMGWALVAAQGGILAAQASIPRGTDWPTPLWLRRISAVAQVAGLAVVAVGARGLGPALTPSPLPTENARLRQDGLYRHVRHPIYSGALMASGAGAVASGNRRQLGAAMLLVALLNYKARFEEAALSERYPEYRAYAARTPRFVPRRTPA